MSILPPLLRISLGLPEAHTPPSSLSPDVPREATWTVHRPKLSQTSWRGGTGSSPHHISMSFPSGSNWAGQMCVRSIPTQEVGQIPGVPGH